MYWIIRGKKRKDTFKRVISDLWEEDMKDCKE